MDGELHEERIFVNIEINPSVLWELRGAETGAVVIKAKEELAASSLGG
jgi:hypothetical protein